MNITRLAGSRFAHQRFADSRESTRRQVSIFEAKAFSPKTGLVFAVNGASAPPPPPPAPHPRPPFSWGAVGVLLKIPRRGGGFSRSGEGGGGRGGGEGALRAPSPIYRENESPLFGENAFSTWSDSRESRLLSDSY